jgi:hypothetical protein
LKRPGDVIRVTGSAAPRPMLPPWPGSPGSALASGTPAGWPRVKVDWPTAPVAPNAAHASCRCRSSSGSNACAGTANSARTESPTSCAAKACACPPRECTECWSGSGSTGCGTWTRPPLSSYAPPTRPPRHTMDRVECARRPDQPEAHRSHGVEPPRPQERKQPRQPGLGVDLVTPTRARGLGQPGDVHPGPGDQRAPLRVPQHRRAQLPAPAHQTLRSAAHLPVLRAVRAAHVRQDPPPPRLLRLRAARTTPPKDTRPAGRSSSAKTS